MTTGIRPDTRVERACVPVVAPSLRADAVDIVAMKAHAGGSVHVYYTTVPLIIYEECKRTAREANGDDPSSLRVRVRVRGSLFDTGVSGVRIRLLSLSLLLLSFLSCASVPSAGHELTKTFFY